tara:strand:- start:5666 stop:6274 length:609 start_codon:yes stop_codon:yes gene_type:complete
MEKQILETFLYNNKLKFSEIEKQLKTRSNKLSYHLTNLVKKGILKKENETYSLSKTSEHLIPYLSNKKSTLPVILIYIGNKSSCFLHKRNKRPFKNNLSLPGGRLLTNESIKKAAKRIMKEKHNINISSIKTNSISIKNVKNKSETLHSFLLIFITAATKDKINLTNIEENKSKIISSDYKLLKNSLKKEIKINTLITKTNF